MRRALLIVALLLVGSARAAEGEDAGLLTATGPVRVPAEATLAGDLLGFRYRQDTTLPAFELNAPYVLVHVTEERMLQTGGFGWMLSNDTRVYPLTNVSVLISSNPRASYAPTIGFYAHAEGARLEALALGEATLEPQDGNGTVENYDVSSQSRWYGRFLAEAHVGADAVMDARASGAGLVTFLGHDVVLVADENVTTHRTGWERADGGGVLPPAASLGPARLRTLHLEMPAFTLRIAGEQPLAAAFAPVLVDSPHGVFAEDVVGSVSIEGKERRATGGRVEIDDPVLFEMVPLDEGGAELRFQQRGGVELASVGTPQQRARVALAAALVAAGVLGALAWRRRRRVAVDLCVDMADRAAETGRFGVALQWTERALRSAPRSAELHANRAFFLASLGDVDRALAAYARAGELAGDGHAPYLAGRLLVETGSPPAAALPHVARALRENPLLAEEVLDEPLFAPLLDEPAVAPLLAEGLRRLDVVGGPA